VLLMIDNYDSFTYNLVQYFGELGEDVRVVRNDEIDVAGIAALKPDRLVLSPGPCSPAEAGICVEAIRHFTGRLPVLGVCLGHQAIGAALGGKVVRAKACRSASPSSATTRWRSSANRCRPCWRSPARSTTARSWVCATAKCRSKACSSTPSPSSASTATHC
jgi:anthranilate synthase/aminodeoxychorismate synthase-like glutamine amidotransferase